MKKFYAYDNDIKDTPYTDRWKAVYLAADVAELESVLAYAVEIFEGDDECGKPGTDAYAWLQKARALMVTGVGK
jgi:hypothetical protein